MKNLVHILNVYDLLINSLLVTLFYNGPELICSHTIKFIPIIAIEY